jgi:hypothetical protein
MSTAAKAPATEPLPSAADFGCWDEALTEYEEYPEPEIANTAAAAAIAAHVAAQTAELRAILERTQADLSRMTDKANRLIAERISTQEELRAARVEEAWERSRADLFARELIAAHKNAAKRKKRKSAK